MSVLAADLHTKLLQRRASDPDVSAWVSANAGAGKTTVLRNRVLRLLLAGVEPGCILCLTFTKAAAAEMSNRVFAELARWVRLDDRELAAAVADIAGDTPSAPVLAAARRLFARAVETPGGLRIDTIHGFCTRLLQAFAFEANVPARFAVLEEQEARDLLDQARHAVLAEALARQDTALFAALSRIGDDVSGTGFAEVVEEALQLPLWRRDVAFAPSFGASLGRDLSLALGIDASLSVAEVEDAILSHAQGDIGRRIVAALGRGTAPEQNKAQRLLAAQDREERLASYRHLLLTSEREPHKRMLTKAAAAADLPLVEAMQAEAGWLLGRLDAIAAVETRERTVALLLLARAIRRRFVKLKSDRGALDFDDLIAATRRLLARASGAFVLYKLDASIEHILVDEAQDTNAEYWEILRAITAEFTAGEGRRGGRLRTVFAVGDEKQSIFGFQGAEPETFGLMRDAFARDYSPLQRDDGSEVYSRVVLNVSFRSTRDVLDAVDAVFEVPEHHEGISADGGRPPPHVSTRLREPGAVDLWPIVEGDDAVPVDPFRPPQIGAPLLSAEVKLARRIADAIRGWTREGCDFGRSVSPGGDVLILVRRRGRIFGAVIRALKRAGVPVAGADRLSLSTHIAVDDLVAAGSAALLPEDDLALAALLKSPFFGLDDDDLLRIAPLREGSLRRALGEAARSDPLLAATDARLDAMRRAALALGPFGFFARLLGPEGGRLALSARLGVEAAEASDEVLRLALVHERGGGATLTGFLDLLRSSGADIKRDLSAPRGEVRVMTVHGAKGLEAPIVILADACSSLQKTDRFFSLPLPEGGEVPAWVPRKELDCGATARARTAAERGRAREDRRLLYVGMTRAADRLIIAGCAPKGRPPPTSWYAMVERALAAKAPGLVELPSEPDSRPVRRWRVTPDAALAKKRSEKSAEAAHGEPGWLRRTPPPEPLLRPPTRPSSALDAADGSPLAGPLPDPKILLAGRFAHLLIQHLASVPEALRGEAAAKLEAAASAGLTAIHRHDIATKVLALLSDPALGILFSEQSLAEVDVIGEITCADGSRRAVSGRIDRLVITPAAVLIADFKTGPFTNERVRGRALVQLAIYRQIVGDLYPGRLVKPSLILLEGPVMIEPSQQELDQAFERFSREIPGSG